MSRVAAAHAELLLLDGDAQGSADRARRGLDRALPSGHPWYVGELAYRLWRAGRLDAAPPGAAADWASTGCG